MIIRDLLQKRNSINLDILYVHHFTRLFNAVQYEIVRYNNINHLLKKIRGLKIHDPIRLNHFMF